MTFISVLRELWRRRVMVAAAFLVAFLVAVFAVYQVSVMPPSLAKKGTVEAHGSSEVLIDSARSPIAGSKRDISGLISRAGVFARLMSGGDVVAQIAKDAGISPKEVDVAGPAPLPGEAPGITEVAETLPYGLSFTEVPELPIVSVITRAPTVREAAALATAAPAALRGVITSVQKQQGTPATERVEVRVLGPAQAQLEDEAPGAKIAAVIFLVVFGLELGLILGLPRMITAWRREDEEEETELAAVPDISEPKAAVVVPKKSRKGKQHDRAGRVRQR